MKAVPGVLALLAGVGLISGPWWSSTLPKSDYPFVIVLGTLFAAIGAYAAVPGTWPRLLSLSLVLFMSAFGAVCAVLTLIPFHPAEDGTWTIAGVTGFVAAPIPLWARIVAGFFAIVCLGTASLGLWGLVRDLAGRRRE
jgi:hypothetical protein